MSISTGASKILIAILIIHNNNKLLLQMYVLKISLFILGYSKGGDVLIDEV